MREISALFSLLISCVRLLARCLSSCCLRKRSNLKALRRWTKTINYDYLACIYLLKIKYIYSSVGQSWADRFNPWIIENPILPLICESDQLNRLSSFSASSGGLCAIFYHIACFSCLETDLYLPYHVALQTNEDKLVFGKPQEASKLSLCEIASRKLFDVESLVETDGLCKECDLQLLVSLLDRSNKLIRTQFQDDICVILSMGIPFVLPEKDC